ncbi:alginate export family protein [Candidatus Colwellia aromaticivorans]|uniref:alginate export family protein n=1 Tax=Candidatus Colwellia aromaticivorans TaxID=2267621 RepID=UPI000DF1303A|nr:alginate export family protein [Candidatus Colwellia aromaticivorans]
MTLNKITLCLALALTGTCSSIAYADSPTSDSITDALINGKTDVNVNLRYETVDQDNALKDADAFTLRTRLTYATGDFAGFSSLIEFEDSRNVLGVDDYNNTLGKNTDYSVIADPETTELDQFLLQYKQKSIAIKVGRQLITMDNHRFVGHVGWRQDRQTFDGVTFAYQPIKGLTLDYGYITKRNRIFAEAKDIDSKDHIINAGYKTSLGKITGYGYLLEVDNDTENALDTFGIRFNGGTSIGEQKVSYQLEYAQQDADSATTSYSADYILAELSTAFSGVGVKVGYELLGSDSGNYGFSTPLATLHKFNGWSDQFLSTPKEGLADLYASVGGKISGGKWAVIYHKFDADEASTTVDDLGYEIDAVYSKKFTKNYSAGIKLASYSAGDSTAGKVDTDKIWVWLNAKF